MTFGGVGPLVDIMVNCFYNKSFSLGNKYIILILIIIIEYIWANF